MVTSECQESVSEDTLEIWYNTFQEQRFRDLKLRKTIETINEIVELYFKNKTIFLSEEILNAHSQLLKDASKMFGEQASIMTSRVIMLESEGPTEKVHLLFIASSKNYIEEMKSFQIRADSLVNRCIDYTPQSSAA